MRDYTNAATSPANRSVIVNLAERLIPPAVMGYRCLPIDEPGLIVNVSVYRDAQHDEDGIPCGRGVISDAKVFWYSEPPEEVLRRG